MVLFSVCGLALLSQQPRGLSQAQKANIINSLKGSPAASVGIGANGCASLAECRSLATDFSNTFASAQWRVTEITISNVLNGRHGIFLGHYSDASMGIRYRAVKGALTAAAISFTEIAIDPPVKSNRPDNDAPLILVGPQ